MCVTAETEKKERTHKQTNKEWKSVDIIQRYWTSAKFFGKTTNRAFGDD
jgi:hypothetical protein